MEPKCLYLWLIPGHNASPSDFVYKETGWQLCWERPVFSLWVISLLMALLPLPPSFLLLLQEDSYNKCLALTKTFLVHLNEIDLEAHQVHIWE